jgi:hypothetical protein
MKRLTFALMILALLASACAYHFGNYGRALPKGYKLVSIPTFDNKTAETGVEYYFTQAMIHEIERSRIGTVTAKKQAQVVLEGAITDLKYIAETPSTGFGTLPEHAQLSKGYRILIDTQIHIRRLSDDKILWSGKFSGETRYAAPQVTEAGINTVNPLYNHSAHHQNIRSLANDMMAEAYDRMTENF